MLELSADDSGSIQPERLGEHIMRDKESIRAIQFLCTYAEHITTVDDDEDTTRTKPSLETSKEESSQEDSTTLSDDFKQDDDQFHETFKTELQNILEHTTLYDVHTSGLVKDGNRSIESLANPSSSIEQDKEVFFLTPLSDQSFAATPFDERVFATQIEHNDVRRAVVKRDDDVLTEEQIRKEWPAIQAAMQKELQTWVDLKCIARKKRKDARNIIDVKWVLKYKWEEAAISATTGASKANSEQTRKKTIRARLTIRGFKRR
jgi:hypothetical protein